MYTYIYTYTSTHIYIYLYKYVYIYIYIFHPLSSIAPATPMTGSPKISAREP